MTFAFGRWRVRIQFNTTTHKGSVATSNAAKLDAMYFSAQVTAPLPHNRSKAPITNARRQCAKDQLPPLPFSLAHAKSIEPAIRNRLAAIRKGGRVSIA